NEFIMNAIDNDEHTEPETTTSSMEFSSNDNSKSLESDLCIIKEINNLHSVIPDENMLSSNDNRK
ncbi:17492_t:CDS:1, partial [Gigaspora margarita]